MQNKKFFRCPLALLFFISLVQAEPTAEMLYYPGDEFAQLAPSAIGSVDSNNGIAPQATVVYNKRVLLFDPGSNSFEQRALFEFEIPDLKTGLEHRLVQSVLLKLKGTAPASAPKAALEIWGYRQTADGRIAPDDFDTGERLGEADLVDGTLSLDVTDFVTSKSQGRAGFRIQMTENASAEGEQKLTFKTPMLAITLAKQIYTLRGRRPASPPLTFTDDASQWNVTMAQGDTNGTVKIETSREVTFFGEPVVRLSYSGASQKTEIHISPVKPLPIPSPFNAASLWSWANTFSYGFQRKIFLVLVDGNGNELSRDLSHLMNQSGPMEHFVNFEQPWSKFNDAQSYALKEIVVKNFTSAPQDFFYLGPLSFYVKSTQTTLPGVQDALKLPSHPNGMVPPVQAEGRMDRIDPKTFVFTAITPDDKVEYRYQPNDGTMNDIRIAHNGKTYLPMTDGGVMSALTGPETLVKGKMISLLVDEESNSVKTEWEPLAGGEKYTMSLSLINQSLVIDISAEGGFFSGFSFGGLSGLPEAKLLEVPYLCSWGKKNGVLGPRVVHSPGTFFLGFVDHYFSNANDIYARNSIDENGLAFYNGGSHYFPDTRNKRHPLQERIILTSSATLQNVLPDIPNPVVFDRQKAKDYYFASTPWPSTNIVNLLSGFGMEDVFLWVFWWNAAPTSWNASNPELSGPGRDGYDWYLPKNGAPCPKVWRSTRPAEFVKRVRDLGWKFGLYTYYIDVNPAAEWFSRDWLALNSNNQPQMGCLGFYWVKPPFMPEFQQKMAASIKKAWGALDGTYGDVATIRCPWGAGVDMDADAPGSGLLSTYFRSIAQTLAQEVRDFGQTWSEGQFGWIYAGLCTGSYGTLLTSSPGGPASVPLLPEFSLRRIHTKSQSVGMGPAYHQFFKTPVPSGDFHNAFIRQYFAALLGYGHMSQYQAWDHGYMSLAGTAKSYYLFKELQKLYAFEPIQTIDYFNGTKFIPTSQAIEDQSYLQGRIREVYENGLIVYVNYNGMKSWTIQVDGRDVILPPWGFYAFHKPTDTLVYSIEKDGGISDYSRNAKYVYADSWNQMQTFDELGIQGAGAIKRLARGKIVFIPLGQIKSAKSLRESPENFGVDLVKINLAKFFPPPAKNESVAVTAVDPDGKRTPYAFTVDKGQLVLKPQAHNVQYEIICNE